MLVIGVAVFEDGMPLVVAIAIAIASGACDQRQLCVPGAGDFEAPFDRAPAVVCCDKNAFVFGFDQAACIALHDATLPVVVGGQCQKAILVEAVALAQFGTAVAGLARDR